MPEDRRSVELDVEVPGTAEAAWRAVATGPGISSWYVPHQVDERTGGTAVASFGPTPEMDVPGRIAVWEPPHRIVFDGGEGVDGLAFEWTVEPRDGGTCLVRLVNTGFGSGAEWDEQYDGMVTGWRMFLDNLRLHMEHFAGQSAQSMLPTAMWAGPAEVAWTRLAAELGIAGTPAVGDRVEVDAADAPTLAGTVVETAPRRVAVLVDDPAPGTAFLAVEGEGEQVAVSVWCYLYGDDGAAAVAADAPRWMEWLTQRASEEG